MCCTQLLRYFVVQCHNTLNISLELNSKSWTVIICFVLYQGHSECVVHNW